MNDAIQKVKIIVSWCKDCKRHDMTSPEVANQIIENKEVIAKAFEEEVRKSLKAARAQSTSALLDHLPEFLNSLADHLKSGADDSTVENAWERRFSRLHGAQRARLQGYTIEQVLSEYRLLRKIIFRTLERDKKPLPVRERDTIIDIVQFAAKHAASQFLHTKIAQIKPFRWLPKTKLSKWLLALLLVGLSSLVQWLLRDSLQYAPYMVYYPMVVLAAFIADGLVVTIVAAIVVQVFFVPPPYVFKMAWPADVIRVALFLFNGFLISMVTKKLQNTRKIASLSAREQEVARHEVESVVKRLESEKRLREQFVATLSHDMRNPIAAIRTSAQMLLRYPDKAEMRNKLADRILQSVDRTDKMILDLLDVGRIREGQKLPLTFEHCTLYQVVETVLEELRWVHGDRFILQGDKSICTYCSVSGVQRIIENLAGNAIKYGALDKPIEVTLSQQENSVQIEVRNDLNQEDEVLTPDDMATIFEPFKRTQDAKTSGKQGWGLGLTLVKGIAEAHGGSVHVKSNADQGTTFIVTLPKKPF